MNIGCHVSIAGGVFNAPERAADFGCESMQIFTRSPQGGKAPELTTEVIEKFKIQYTKYNIQNTYIHTPFYINYASADNRIRHSTVSIVRDELERASLLGAKYVMTHLGSAGELSENEATEKVAEMLKRTLDGYEGSAELLLENAAGSGKIIGATFSQLAQILKLVNHTKLVGICLDTQHSFASGYDWRDFENTLKKIDSEIGLEKIKLIHCNDSLTECGSKKDRHAHIGKGLIGETAFKKITAFAQKNNINMICETEYDFVPDDISLLKKFRG